eukprot:m51a1_g14106 hypothetical protein (1624) ;mRNA; f:105409-110926
MSSLKLVADAASRTSSKAKLAGIPPSLAPIAFGRCAVGHPVSRTFSITNSGPARVDYAWRSSAPFAVVPAAGSLAPAQPVTFTATFAPAEAAAYEAACVLVLGPPAQLEWRLLRLAGAGRYPFVEASAAALDFGDVPAGRPVTRELTLRNPSAVAAAVCIERAPESASVAAEAQFKVSPAQLTVAAGGSAVVRVTFAAAVVGARAAETFSVAVERGNAPRLSCSGTAVGPTVALSTSSVCFGSIAVGTTTSRILTLRNDSDEAAYYQFTTNHPNNGVFRFEPAQGQIAKGSKVSVAVRFHPHTTIAYSKRVWCLLKNLSPLYVDVMGSAYDDGIRPPTLCQRHLDVHAARVVQDATLAGLPPERLEEVFAQRERDEAAGKRRVTRFSDKVETAGPAQAAVPAVAMTPRQERKSEALQAFSSYLESEESAGEVAVLDDAVDFLRCDRSRPIEPAVVRVRNNAKGRVFVSWALPQPGPADQATFSVTPANAEVEAGQVMPFKVHFRPPKDNESYGETLELYACHRSMRNFRMVSDRTMVPPWHMSVSVFGNTFLNSTEQLVSKISLSARKIVFAPVSAASSDHQTIRISSTGDSAISGSVDILQNAQKNAFSCVPHRFFLQPGEFQIITFHFLGPHPGKFSAVAQFTINGYQDSVNQVSLVASCAVPRILIENDSQVFMKPTCVGTTSARTFAIRNGSGAPVLFKWEAPERFKDVFLIHPASGVVRPNDELHLTCTFTPLRPRRYHVSIPCVFASSESPLDQSMQRMALGAFGEGVEARLSVSRRQVDFGDVLVGCSSRETVTVYNPTQCWIRYRVMVNQGLLRLAPTAADFDDDDETTEECETQSSVSCPPVEAPSVGASPTEGVIAARSRARVAFTLRPTFRRRYSVSARIVIASEAQRQSSLQIYAGVSKRSPPPSPREGKQAAARSPEKRADEGPSSITGPTVSTIEIQGSGALPTLAITNVHREGYSKNSVWHAFEVSLLNEELATDLTSDERKLLREGVLPSASDIESCLSCFTFNFGSSEVGSSPSVVSFQLSNVGPVPLSWNVRFQNSPLVRQEPWMTFEDRSEYERKQAAAIENGIFRFSTMSGDLGPGQSGVVTVAFSHDIVDQHEVPMILSVRRGKAVLLRLCGSTLQSCEPVLEHPHALQPSSRAIVHPLPPAAVGVPAGHAPVHFYALRNPCAREVEYAFDLDPLEQLKALNHGARVMDCENPRGRIAARETAYVRWVFRPLEVKQYSCTVPVTASGKRSATVTLSSSGFHPRDETDQPRDEWESSEQPQRGDFVFPGQLGTAFPDTLILGHVPLHAEIRRLVNLRNAQPESVRFVWDLRNVPPYNDLVIEPSSGILRPGQSLVCKLTFIGRERPALFDFDAPCFLSTLDDVPAPEDAAGPGTYVAPTSRSPASDESDLVFAEHKSGVSDPRRGPSFTGAPRSLSSSNVPTPTQRSAAGVAEMPKPTGRTCVVFVTIQARTHALEEFRALGNDVALYHIEAPTAPEDDPGEATPAGIAQEAADVASEAAIRMVKEIMQDSDVVAAAETGSDKPSTLLYEHMRPLPPTQEEDVPDPKSEADIEMDNMLKVYRLDEFKQFAEGVLEGTLTNMMKEALSGAWDVTRPLPVVANNI